MIVLDTNVISELMRRAPNAGVITWVGEQPMAGLFTTTFGGTTTRTGGGAS